MRTVITGAGGFVGQALARRMAELGHEGPVRLVDQAPPSAPAPQFESVAVDLRDTQLLRTLVGDAACVVHLAALPGGAAEADPQASRAINLDVSLDLIGALTGTGARLVCASSVAVFGVPLPERVGDELAPAPTMTYGTHKRMVELALCDARRRGEVNGMALRLPGIVARPGPASGFKSAFLNDIFWAVRDARPYILPVSPAATSWLMSARLCADNILHALQLDAAPAVVTLPALLVRIDQLVAEIARQSARDAANILYAPDPAIERHFGSYSALDTPAADALGFRHDGGLPDLVRSVLSDTSRISEEMVH